MTTTRRAWGIAALMAASFAVGACSLADTEGSESARPGSSVAADRVPDGPDSADEAAYVLENIQAMSQARNIVSYAQSFADYLPNRRFSITGGEPFTLASSVVRGKVVEAKPGAGYYVPGDDLSPDAPRGTEIDFYDERAQWRQIEVVVEIIDGLGDVPDSGRLSFALTSGVPDADRALRGAAALGEVVVALESAGRLAFNKEAFTVAHWGDALATVGEGGVLSFPAFGDEGMAKRFVGDLNTWETIKTEAAITKPVTDVETLLGEVK